MADYGTDIDLSNWSYRKPVYYTNPLDYDREDVIIRMILDSSNFNFNITKSDLGDLRIAENFDGTNVLRMWIAYYNSTTTYVTIFFKLPKLLASQTITLWCFFGNSSATLVNEPDKIGFLFYDTFDISPLSSSKWSGDLNNTINTYGYDLSGNGALYDTAINGSVGVIRTTTSPLNNKMSWILEAGTYLNGDYGGGIYSGDNEQQERAYAIGFIGSENSFGIQYVASTTWKGVCTNIETGSWVFLSNSINCPEPYSYQENFIAYQEETDVVYQRSFDRNTFTDTANLIYRKKEGETKLSNIAIIGRLYDSPYWVGAGWTYISWIVARPFDVNYRALVDCSELYAITTCDRIINHQPLDYNNYGDDITGVLYRHESSFGGDPLLLSDDLSDTAWVSSVDATLESEISVTIDFGVVEDLTNYEYAHYDSGHIKYFGASKLSDNDGDVWGRNFWNCSSATNGWAAIKFNEACVINSFSITTVAENLTCGPKNYIFFGSNYNPTTDLDKAVELTSGMFSNTALPQQVFFSNIAKYKYYVLFVLNNYGGSDIRIQEWEMYNRPKSTTKKIVSQLRLLPPTDDLLYSFPNEISLQASVDKTTWDTLIPWTQTYSPFIQHYSMYGFWQRYSFIDPAEKRYFAYRLLCRGNWGDSSGRIAIKEWELCELAFENNTYRILNGSLNIIKQIWASEKCGINDINEMIYVTNDKLNYIINDYNYSVNLPENYNDLNVITGV